MASSTMRAAIYTSTSGGLEQNLTINDSAPRPPPLRPGESLVRVAYTALNPADYKLAELPVVGRFMTRPPATPGFDFSGRVVDTQNPALAPGQLVFGRLDGPSKHGCAAEYTVTPQNGTFPLPSGVPLATGAAMGTAALSAWQSIAPTLKSKPAGARVLVNGGSGGCGIWGIQLAKALGAGHITSTSSAGNAALCAALGAAETLDYRAADVSATLAAAARADPALRFDLVFDAVGAPADLHRAGDAFMKVDAHFRQIGAGTSVVRDVPNLLGRMCLPSFLGGGARSFKFISVVNNPTDFKEIAAIVERGEAKAVVDETFELADVGKAFEKLRTGRAKGKILVRVAGEEV